jgi:hypothetical protein
MSIMYQQPCLEAGLRSGSEISTATYLASVEAGLLFLPANLSLFVF